MPGFTLFDTALGRCGLAWSEVGVAAVRLPETDERAMRRQLAAAVGAGETTPPAATEAVVRAIVTLLDGREADLSAVDLDIDEGPTFDRRVWAYTRTIPRGATRTYGAVARALGTPGLAQAVGGALGRNPVPIIVPCHRVVAAGGRAGGFSAPGGARTKLRLLAIERALSGEEPGLFDALADPPARACPLPVLAIARR